jgi:hypothetical protein
MPGKLAIVWMCCGLLSVAGCGTGSQPQQQAVPKGAVPKGAVPQEIAPNGTVPEAAPETADGSATDAPTSAWQKDGEAADDTESMKSKDGFGAQLFLTESQEFFDDWNKPETPELRTTETAQRNVPIFTVIMFVGPGMEGGQAKINFHVAVRRPDGSIYGEADLVGWDQEYPFSPENLQLTKQRMGIRIEPTDPAGTYTVEATVRDEVKQVELPLKMTFDVAAE